MKTCTRCSTVNPDEAVSCKKCGDRTFYLNRPRNSARNNSNIGIRNLLSARAAGVLICIFMGAAVAEGYWRESRLSHLQSELAAERTKLTTEHAGSIAEQDRSAQLQMDKEEADQKALLQNPEVLSGAAARERHEKEWAMRMAHNGRLASTVLETNLLLMEELGQDTTLTAQTVLEKVAVLAAPPDSRAEVTPDGSEFRIRVAFMMSRLSSREAGAVTKYHTTSAMRDEIQELSARVMRDLYSYCGSRGIKSISVTCNHTVRQTVLLDGATKEEQKELFERAKPVPARLYRVSLNASQAGAIADWRQAPLSRVIELVTVEYDGLVHLTITRDRSTSQEAYDAPGELQF